MKKEITKIYIINLEIIRNCIQSPISEASIHEPKGLIKLDIASQVHSSAK
jgi:hypothetical protein